MDWHEKISPPMLGGGKRCTDAENNCRRISHGRIRGCWDEHNRITNKENEADNSMGSDKRIQESDENSKQSVKGDANKCQKVASSHRRNEDSYKNKKGMDRGNSTEIEDDCRNSRQIDKESLNRSSTSEAIQEEDNDECWGDLDQMLKEFYQETTVPESYNNSSSAVEGECNKKDKQIENALDHNSLGKDIAERNRKGIDRDFIYRGDRDTKGMNERGMDSKGISRGVINTEGMSRRIIGTVDIGRGSTGNRGLDTIGIGRGAISREGFDNGDKAKVGINRLGLETVDKGKGKSRERLHTGSMDRGGLDTGGMSRGEVGRGRLDTDSISREVMSRDRLDTGSIDRGGVDNEGVGRGGLDTGGVGRGGLDTRGMGRGGLDTGGMGRGGLDTGGMGRGGLDTGGMGRGGLDTGGISRRESDVNRGSIGRGLDWDDMGRSSVDKGDTGKGTVDSGSSGSGNVENESRSSKISDVVHREDIEKLAISWDNVDHILQEVCDETPLIVNGGNHTGLTEEYSDRDSWNNNHGQNNQRRGIGNRNRGGRGWDKDRRNSRGFGDRNGDVSRPDEEEYINGKGQASNTHGRNSNSLDILKLAQVNNCRDIETLTGRDERGIEISQSKGRETLSRRNEMHVGKGREIQAIESMDSENSADRIEGGIVKIKGTDKDTMPVRVEGYVGRTQGILDGKIKGLVGEKCKTQDYDGRIKEKRKLGVCSYQDLYGITDQEVDQTNHLQGQNDKLENECLSSKTPEVEEEDSHKKSEKRRKRRRRKKAQQQLELQQQNCQPQNQQQQKEKQQQQKEKQQQQNCPPQNSPQQNGQLQNRQHQIRQLQIQNQPQQNPKLQTSALQWQQFQTHKQELQSKRQQQFHKQWQQEQLQDQQQEQELEKKKTEGPREGLTEGKVGKVIYTLAGHTVKNNSDAMLGVQVVRMLLNFLKDHSCITNNFQTFQVVDHALVNMDSLKWFMDKAGCY